jgi:hypothetical protein
MSADQLNKVKPIFHFNLNGKVAVVIGTVGFALYVIEHWKEGLYT